MRNIWMMSMVLALLAQGIGTPQTAHANDSSLPTAASPAQGQWGAMRENSHEATSEDARRQCRRNVDAGEIAIGYAGCDLLEQMIDSGEGDEVWVPDGIVFNVNNGFNPSQGSFSTYLVEKRLGRLDRAELYYVGTDPYGNRYYAYFFRGQDTSCNNIAWVILPPELVEVVTYNMAPPPPPKIVCRLVLAGRETALPKTQFVPGFLLPSCCPTCVGPTYIPPLLLQQPGGSSTTWIRVCEPEGE